LALHHVCQLDGDVKEHNSKIERTENYNVYRIGKPASTHRKDNGTIKGNSLDVDKIKDWGS
jgi:hypothetical protein